MTITNTYRWNGKLGSNWNALIPNPAQTNWDLIDGNATPPSYPGGLGDLAVFDLGGAIEVTAKTDSGASGNAGAEEIQIANATEVTFSQDFFAAGFDGSGGLLIDEDSSLTLSDGATMGEGGSLDIVGLTSAGTLVVEAGTGFSDRNLIVGADEGASGEVTINSAFGFEVAGSTLDGTTGVLTVGEDGVGTVDVTDTQIFNSNFAILGKNDGSSGSVTLDDSIWGGYSLTVGLAGTGRAEIDSGSTVAFFSISIGPDGLLDVTGAAGATSQVMAPNLALNGGTIDVTGGGEVMVGTGTGAPGTVAVGGIPLVGLGTVKGDVAVQNGGVVEAELVVPGVLTIDGNVVGNGTIEPVQTLEVTQGIASGVTILFNPLLGGTGGDLVLDTPRADLGTIVGFAAGNTIDIAGSLYSNTVFTQGGTDSAGTLTLSGGGALPLSIAVAGTYSPDSFLATPEATDTIVTLACFVAGTRIATATGEVKVDDLRVGDRVRCLMQGTATVAWIGTGRARVTRGRRTAATPVIVRKGALADNVPHRDLRITKGHSLYLDGVLIPVEFLVNHRSIIWDDWAQEVTIFHIELATHDVLIAEGAPAESYRDDGNRWLFQNANAGWGRPPATPCATVLTGGPVVDATWRRLLDRAGPRSSLPLTDDPDLHLVIDGQRVDAIEKRPDARVFRLRMRPQSVRICSRAAVPQELGTARDDRELGVAVRRIVLADARRMRALEAGAASLTDGYHAFEADNGVRWTNGNAAVPVDLFSAVTGPCMLMLYLGGAAQYLDEGLRLSAA
ncbi:MAG TPA: Hint domain-containing protein [Acetobacteraceae bacterium]|nr:Hint domain-containing protein [Acetobacteraceae bacterium]